MRTMDNPVARPGLHCKSQKAGQYLVYDDEFVKGMGHIALGFLLSEEAQGLGTFSWRTRQITALDIFHNTPQYPYP